MPPLAILFIILGTALVLARTCVPAQCKLYSEHPTFISDVLHGICPKCGMKDHVEEPD